MTDPARSPKIKPWHLDRIAIVYVRQSDPQQVVKHPESTARQYALLDRAVALGWPRERVRVIDEDQGKTGSTAEGRPRPHRPDPRPGGEPAGAVLQGLASATGVVLPV